MARSLNAAGNLCHTYITYLHSLSVDPLFICRQTGTSLEMFQERYAKQRVLADELDDVIERDRKRGESGNLGGTFDSGSPTADERGKKDYRQFSSLSNERATGVEPATSGLGRLGGEVGEGRGNQSELRLSADVSIFWSVPYCPTETRGDAERRKRRALFKSGQDIGQSGDPFSLLLRRIDRRSLGHLAFLRHD